MLIKAAFLAACAATVLVCTQGSFRRVCYYTNWAQYRPNYGRYLPQNIDPNMCTHYIYAFATFNEEGKIHPYEWNDESTQWSAGMYEQFQGLKKQNPELKTLLAVGGWNVASGPFTKMVQTQESRHIFIESAIALLRKWNFDGLDVDWEYPANRGSPAGDRHLFTSLISELREQFEQESALTGHPRLLLTAALAAGKSTIDTAYDIPSLMQHLDFASVMTYDLHGAWETVTGHHTALYPRADETGDDLYLNVDFAVNYWVQLGASKEKLNVGLATYWRTFTLESTSQTGLGAPAKDSGDEGPESRTKGFLAYYEVCDMRQSGGQVHEDQEQSVRYISNGNQWAGGEDTISITQKTCYIKQKGFGGVMVWAPDLDDFSGGKCREGTYPLMNAIIRELNSPSFINCPTRITGPVQPVTTRYHVSTEPPHTSGVPSSTNPTPTGGHIINITYDFSCIGLHNGFYPNPKHCDQYYVCVNEVAYGVQCLPGKLYNISTQDCQVAADCPYTQTVPTTPYTTVDTANFCFAKADGVYRDPRDCGRYIQCASGVGYGGRCPGGLVFSEHIQTCQNPIMSPECYIYFAQ